MAMARRRRARKAAPVPGDEVFGRTLVDVVAASRDAFAFVLGLLASVIGAIRVGPVQRARPFREAACHVEHTFGRCTALRAADRQRIASTSPYGRERSGGSRVAPRKHACLRAARGGFP